MIVRHLTRLAPSSPLPLSLRFHFSSPFFTKSESITEPINKSELRFAPQEKQAQNIKKENLSALVEKINDANKYFLGVKLNTNYLKVNKIVNYNEVAALTTETKNVNDIPIQISKKEPESAAFEKASQSAALAMKSGQIAFSRARLQPTLKQMKKIVQEYIINIAKKGRFSNIEPNFELQCIKTMNSLDQKLHVKLENEEAEPEIKITKITLLKGLTAYRNDNYSTDSYEKNQEQASDGIITYKLYRQLKEEYPEVEWFSTKRITARFELLVKGGPTLNILQSGNSLGTTSNVIHSAVIETDLIPPPPHAQKQLTPQEYLRSYRLSPKSLLLTNFDRKNSFYGLTYTEAEKKTILVNRIL